MNELGPCPECQAPPNSSCYPGCPITLPTPMPRVDADKEPGE